MSDEEYEKYLSKKKKKIFLIILGVILLIFIIIVAIVVKSWDKEETNFKGDEIEQTKKDNNESEQEESKFDPYKNFKNLTWSTKTTLEAEIIDNKVYYDLEELELDIEGTYKSIEVLRTNSTSKVYILTEEGKVWSFNVYFMDDVVEVDNLVEHLQDKKILEMIYRDTSVIESIYFLTDEGELIDINKIPYDKYDFVGAISTTLTLTKIPYDSNNYLYHLNEEKSEYEQIINKSKQKISASKVIQLASADEILIHTAHGYLFKYDGKSNIAIQVAKEIKSVDFYKLQSSEGINMVMTNKDGGKTINYNVAYAYDVKKGEIINLEEVKTLDPYADYTDVIWAKTRASIGEGEGYREIYCETDSSLNLVIGDPYTDVKNLTMIEGTPNKVHIYAVTDLETNVEHRAAYVLTEEGKVYEINVDNGITSEITALSKYNIIDMACLGAENKTMCFLTEAGELLTAEGTVYTK